MKAKNIIPALFILVGLVLFSGCTKEPGIGGKASVNGYVYTYDYNGAGTLVDEYDAQDQRVYLIYGTDDEIIDDDTRTSYDGSFEFKYLNKGKYKLFVYSAYSVGCTSCPSGADSVVMHEFEITGNKEVVELGRIDIRK